MDVEMQWKIIGAIQKRKEMLKAVSNARQNKVGIFVNTKKFFETDIGVSGQKALQQKVTVRQK